MIATPSDPVVVTGARGFLGRHVVRSLERRGQKVRAVGRQDGDLRDPATRGAALDVVRERWRCSSLSPLYNGAYGTDSWIIVGSWPACIPIARNAPTEAEALVAALEAAP